MMMILGEDPRSSRTRSMVEDPINIPNMMATNTVLAKKLRPPLHPLRQQSGVFADVALSPGKQSSFSLAEALCMVEAVFHWLICAIASQLFLTRMRPHDASVRVQAFSLSSTHTLDALRDKVAMEAQQHRVQQPQGKIHTTGDHQYHNDVDPRRRPQELTY
eukprot:CAMPEP_0172931582 /NCGR_PEP_ID=MMETSP1075-20121228/219568_1 /TAXON_ID=2916 /ORGANISM="Ceratium fusus, Strain PA161109" /LENGTH=160 /DNA_ID=CAMNT_0013792905 /DNA_START=600 /DNA_END=1084 /DNA_ORIENTATION=+